MACNVRHGAVIPQNAALSQKPIIATIQSRHGTVSLTRRIVGVSGTRVLVELHAVCVPVP